MDSWQIIAVVGDPVEPVVKMIRQGPRFPIALRARLTVRGSVATAYRRLVSFTNSFTPDRAREDLAELLLELDRDVATVGAGPSPRG